MTKITEKNFSRISGQIIKFFNHDELITWHQFDCGAKKRIGHIIKMDPLIIDGNVIEPGRDFNTMHRMYRVTCTKVHPYIYVEYDMAEHVFHDWDPGEIDYDCMVSITTGDEISFLGNRIVLKKRYPFRNDKYQYVYEVFQIGGRFDDRRDA